MNPAAILNTPFIQIALPIIITFITAAWLSGKRLDDFRSDLNRRFDQIDRRFTEVGSRFDSVERRLEMIQANTHDLDIRVTRLEARL